MMITNYYRDEVLAVPQPAPKADDPQPPAQTALGAPVFLSASQRQAAGDIQRSLAERHVYAAVTGAPGVGKTVVLAAVAAQSGPSLRIARIDQPDRVSVEQAMLTERMMTVPAAASPGGHTVLIVDDADRASAVLLRCLTRVAASGRRGPGSSQVVLAGRPELWDRLAADEFTPLRERIAVRPIVRPMTDEDARGFIKHLLSEPRKIFGQSLAEDAEREVLRLADGRPERIGALVRSTLMLGDLQIRPQLSVEMVRTTADMLDGQQRPGGRRRTGVLRPVLAASLAAAMAGGLVVAARGGRLDPTLSAAHGVADRAVAWWMRPAGDAFEVAAVALAPLLEAQSGPVGIAAESPPQSPMAARDPAPEQAPASMPPETNDAAAVAASATPVSASPSPEADRMQDANETAEPAPAAEAATPSQDAPDVAADPPQAAPTAEAAAPAPSPNPVPEAAVDAPSAGPNAPTTPERSPAVPAPGMVATLLRRGDEVLALGDVSQARRFYERTIPAESALGARGVARTYDPAVVGRGSPAADPGAAAAWYDRAARLEGRLAGHEASAPPINSNR